MTSNETTLLHFLPPDARPREKLLARGAQSLADAELLALVLRTGTAGQNVLRLAQSLLDTVGGLAGLLSADASTLKPVKGLGPAKQAELLAVFEIARRALSQPLQSRVPMTDAAQAGDFLRLSIGHLPHEVFGVLYLDSQHRLIAFEEMFRGTITQASVYPREIVTRALDHRACAVVLAHNHPSGMADPSPADQTLTQRLRDALALVDVRVLDHLVVTRTDVRSMAQLGLL